MDQLKISQLVGELDFFLRPLTLPLLASSKLGPKFHYSIFLSLKTKLIYWIYFTRSTFSYCTKMSAARWASSEIFMKEKTWKATKEVLSWKQKIVAVRGEVGISDENGKKNSKISLKSLRMNEYRERSVWNAITSYVRTIFTLPFPRKVI